MLDSAYYANETIVKFDCGGVDCTEFSSEGDGPTTCDDCGIEI